MYCNASHPTYGTAVLPVGEGLTGDNNFKDAEQVQMTSKNELQEVVSSDSQKLMKAQVHSY
jgi:hypothetical protein